MSAEHIDHASRRRGVALLEVLVAIGLLAAAGVAWMSFVGHAADAAQTALAREAQLQRASALVREIVLWGVDDLTSHIGTATVRGFDVTVVPLAASLWSVSVADTATHAIVLATSLYVADSSVRGVPSSP